MNKNKPKNTKGSPLLLILELALTGVMLFCMCKIGYTLLQYRKGADRYETIRTEVTGPSREGNSIPDGYGIDFDALQRMYPDAVAWLRCQDTNIDYPVMQGADNDYYLRRLPDGTRNMSGSLFLDYRCSADFSGAVAMIYGHNMKDGSMFACLENYNDQSWYDAHPALELAVPGAVFSLPVLYGFEIPAQEWPEQGFDTDPAALIQYAAARTTFESNAVWDGSSPLLALLTCTSHDDQVRYVVLCQVQAP